MKKVLFIIFITLSLTKVIAQNENLSIESFGAKPDGIVAQDGAIKAGSAILTSESALFTKQDIGKIIYIANALADSNTLVTNISSILSNHSVRLANSAQLDALNTGLTYGTDCTNAFLAWNKAARSLSDKNVILNLHPGTYLTSFNNWLTGIKNITVNGNGCDIICTHGAIDPLNSIGNNVGLYMPSCFNNTDNNYSTNKSNSDNEYGYRIESASEGNNSIKTVKISDAANFTAGNWILVYGFHHEDFNGYPPDPRFFEYVKIKATDKKTGTIQLDRKLINNYDEDWPDGLQKGGVGAPRVLNLNRNNFTTFENINLNDLNFLPFNGWNGKYSDNIRNGRFTIYGYINATIKNVKASAAYLGQGKNLIIDGCTFKYQCEPDKVLDSVIIKNSNIKDMVNAGGLNYLHLINNTFTGVFNASPHVLYLDENTFETTGGSSTSMASIGFNKGTDYVRVGINTWRSPNKKISTLFSEPNSTKFKIDQMANSNTALIPYSVFVANKNSRQVIPGATGFSTTKNKFKILRVYKYDDSHIAVSGNFLFSPAVGDIFEFSYEPDIDIVGKQIKSSKDSSIINTFKSHKLVNKFNSIDNN